MAHHGHSHGHSHGGHGNEIDAVIAKCVDEIWDKYDVDNSGALDKEETKKFVQDTLSDMPDGAGFNDDDFD